MYRDSEKCACKLRRFREDALPHLDAVFLRAKLIARDIADAEELTLQCYKQAMRDFEDGGHEDIRLLLYSALESCRSSYVHSCSDRLGREIGVEGREMVKYSEPRQTRSDGNSASSADIIDIVSGMPRDLQEVVIMREFDGLSYRAMASLLGVSISTVISRLADARAMMVSSIHLPEQVPELCGADSGDYRRYHAKADQIS